MFNTKRLAKLDNFTMIKTKKYISPQPSTSTNDSQSHVYGQDQCSEELVIQDNDEGEHKQLRGDDFIEMGKNAMKMISDVFSQE